MSSSPSAAPRRVVVSGSSGLIGTALVKRLAAAGYSVVRLVRRPPLAGEIRWNPDAGELNATELEGVDAVVNLAGAGIGEERWSKDYKQKLVNSRVASTTLLSRTLASLASPPQVLLSASAIGYYGDRSDEELDESSPPGDGFLADLAVQWEASTAAASTAGIKVAHFRTGIVLAPDGGALAKQLPQFKFGAGGKLGSGEQWQSWIALDDEVGALEHLLTAGISGPVNLTAPTPVRNADFAAALAKVLHRPNLLRVPQMATRLVLGREMADELLFASQRVLPKVLLESGYSFQYPTLEPALRAILA